MKGNQLLPGCDPRIAPAQSESNPPHRILVVEDDAVIRRLNTTVLSASGYEVDAAVDGAAAWRALSAEDYDLMVTDNNMPKLTGIELLGRLRSARMVLPVIMATGTFPTQEWAVRPWLKPDATLLKPYSGEDLLRTVKKVLREADGAAASHQLFMEHYKGQQNQAGCIATRDSTAMPDLFPRRILVADQDRDLRLLYAEALTRPGCCVDAAPDGVAAWEALQAGNYHLLITEHDLPKLTGIELVKRLRAAFMTLPVVMAAGRLPVHELARNPALQLAATLSKPFAVEALQATVQDVLYATDTPQEPIESLPTWRNQRPLPVFF